MFKELAHRIDNILWPTKPGSLVAYANIEKDRDTDPTKQLKPNLSQAFEVVAENMTPKVYKENWIKRYEHLKPAQICKKFKGQMSDSAIRKMFVRAHKNKSDKKGTNIP